MRKVVLLGRVSRGERTQDPEGQLQALRAAAERFGWVVVKELSFKLSAWDDDQAARLQRAALEPIERGEADTLAVWAWDRFDRGGIESAFRLLSRLERHLGAAFYSLQEPFLSTATADPETRELMIALAAWSAKRESQRKSERLKAKAQTKRARAEAGGGRAIWGRGRMPTTADVAQIGLLRDRDGLTIRGIAAETGLSRGTVHNVLRSRVHPQAEGQTPELITSGGASSG